MPFFITVKVFSASGEEVALLYHGSLSAMPSSPKLSGAVVQPGYQGQTVEFAGMLENGASTIAWEGGSNSGAHVAGGVYDIQITSTDQFGASSSYNLPVTVIAPKPDNEINIFNSAGEIVYHQAFSSLTVTVTDLALDQLAFAPAAGKLTGQLRSTQGALSGWSWDGRGNNGQLLSPGLYTIQLLSDAPGQGSKPVMRQVQILGAPDTSDAQPSAAALGLEIRVRYDASAVACCLRARLYTLAGELTAQTAGGSTPGSFSIPCRSLASGVYIVTVEYQTPAGQRKRSLLKVALLR